MSGTIWMSKPSALTIRSISGLSYMTKSGAKKASLTPLPPGHKFLKNSKLYRICKYRPSRSPADHIKKKIVFLGLVLVL